MKSWRFLDWHHPAAHVAAQLQVEPRDLWVGAFWRFHRTRGEHTGWDKWHGDIAAMPWSLQLYICLLPLLPLHIFVQRTVRP